MVDFRRGSEDRDRYGRSRPSDTWRGRFPEEITCVRCLDVVPTDDLDRLMWCPGCRTAARERAERWGWWVGAAVAGALVAWLALVVRPAPDLIMGGWLACVLAAFYLGARVAREVGYGVERFRNRRAAEAVPPASPPADP